MEKIILSRQAAAIKQIGNTVKKALINLRKEEDKLKLQAAKVEALKSSIEVANGLLNVQTGITEYSIIDLVKLVQKEEKGTNMVVLNDEIFREIKEEGKATVYAMFVPDVESTEVPSEAPVESHIDDVDFEETNVAED